MQQNMMGPAEAATMTTEQSDDAGQNMMGPAEAATMTTEQNDDDGSTADDPQRGEWNPYADP